MHIGRKLYLGIGVGATGLIAALAMLVSSALLSEPLHAASTNPCSLKTIKGTWIFEARGVVKDGDKVQHWAEAGVRTLDGTGHATGLWSGSVDGVAIARQKPLTATYQLNAGCVFTANDSEGLSFDLYPVDQGATMTYFSPGVSGTMFKR